MASWVRILTSSYRFVSALAGFWLLTSCTVLNLEDFAGFLGVASVKRF